MALEFDGVDQHVDCGADASLNFQITDPFSFSVWIKSSDTSEQHIFSDYGPTLKGYYFAINPNGKIVLTFRDGVIQYRSSSGDTVVTDGNLHYIVATYDGDGAATDILIYLDGSSDGNNVATAGALADIQTAYNAWIGDTPGYETLPYEGSVFDMRVYNRMLTPAEIKAVYYAQGADNIVNGLVGRWLMNEKPDGSAASGANVVIDISGQGNHGTPANSPVYRASSMRLIKIL